jgi:hypothetical protein
LSSGSIRETKNNLCYLRRKIKINFLKNHYSLLAPIGCFLFGVVLLFTVIAAGDGTWFFYAQDFLNGKKIYTDLHLVQQPLFILINALGISMFGTSFYAQKVIFVPILVCYLLFSYLLVIKAGKGELFRTALFFFFFFVGIHFEAYRFDDYHVFANMLIVLVVWLLINYLNEDCQYRKLIFIATGCAVAMCILTRVNDGLLLMASASLLFSLHRKPGYVLGFILYIISIVAVLAFVLIIIDESVYSWLHSTVIDAMASKGGGRIILAPFNLARSSIEYIFQYVRLKDALLILLLVGLAVSTYNIFLNASKIIKAFTFTFFLIANALIFWVMVKLGINLIILMTAVAIPLTLAFGITRLFSYYYQVGYLKNGYDIARKEFILIIPFSMFISGSLSTGGGFYGLYFPLALLVVSFFLIIDIRYLTARKLFVVGILMLYIACFGFLYRLYHPYSWHSYSSPSLMSKRIIINTKVLGSLPLDPELDRFIYPVCKIADYKKFTLLSIPFPFGNYMCGIAPWHDYVQTFFDTTPKSKIDSMIIELDRKPPDLILYQQQLSNLRLHEIVFNHGNPLPQRRLDAFIIKKIRDGEWRVAYLSTFGSGNKWLLIETNVDNLILK